MVSSGVRRLLILHPETRCEAVTKIEVDVERPRAMQLRIRFLVTGTLPDVRVPAVSKPARADELWKHTCFEAFVRGEGNAYYEFNFAPSAQWAAYAFSDYRSGMKAVDGLSAPTIAIASDETRLELEVLLALEPLTTLPADAAWHLGLSAVIEETNGRRKSYWALEHPMGKPDFHHSDCFVLTLPSASRA